jgi:hypothetical protein
MQERVMAPEGRAQADLDPGPGPTGLAGTPISGGAIAVVAA